MNVDNCLTGNLSVESDSDSTQNSIENGRHCVVRVRTTDTKQYLQLFYIFHCFSFGTVILLSKGKSS